jgi:hypothetical protein
MSHWVHCFMDCNQLFIPEPLRSWMRAPVGDNGILSSYPRRAAGNTPLRPARPWTVDRVTIPVLARSDEGDRYRTPLTWDDANPDLAHGSALRSGAGAGGTAPFSGGADT